MIPCRARVSNKEQLQLHLEDMDVQHRRAAQLVGELANQLDPEERRSGGAQRLLASFISFMEIHFSDEEEFMKQNAYPPELTKLHEAAHGEFLRKLRMVEHRTDADLQAIGTVLVAWIRSWTEDHLYSEDQPYREYFRRELRV